jgi:hypothetical protein
MALMEADAHVVFVEFDKVIMPSDITGLNRVRWPSDTTDLLRRLHSAGCRLNEGARKRLSHKPVRFEDNKVGDWDFSPHSIDESAWRYFDHNIPERGAFGVKPELDSAKVLRGTRCLRCVIPPEPRDDGLRYFAGAYQGFLLEGRKPSRVEATAFSRAKGVTGDRDGDYSLWLDVQYEAHGLRDYKYRFKTRSHDWEPGFVEFEPIDRIDSLSVNLVFRSPHSGTVWFDCVSLRILE